MAVTTTRAGPAVTDPDLLAMVAAFTILKHVPFVVMEEQLTVVPEGVI